MPADSPFDINNLGGVIGKLAGDARKNMDKWWYPATGDSISVNHIEKDSGLRQFLYTNLVAFALKKDKSIFRKLSSHSEDHLQFESEEARSKFVKKLKGKVFYTRFNRANNTWAKIIILDHGFAHLDFYQDENMHILEYDVISFDPKFVTTHFNR